MAAGGDACVVTVILNCDCGEGVADDAAILPYVTAANIACGGHAGDERTMRETLRLCRQLGVSAGAHPSFPDRVHFGRRVLPLSPEAVAQCVHDQVQHLLRLAEAEGIALVHVKPHGALYNHAARHSAYAEAVARAVAACDPQLVLVGPPNSALIAAAEAIGLRVWREAFADRAYERDGTLRSRELPGALIEDPSACLAQAEAILLHRRVRAHDGAWVPIEADTLCIHSDTPGAAVRAAFLREGLARAGVAIARPTR